MPVIVGDCGGTRLAKKPAGLPRLQSGPSASAQGHPFACERHEACAGREVVVETLARGRDGEMFEMARSYAKSLARDAGMLFENTLDKEENFIIAFLSGVRWREKNAQSK